MVYHDDTGITTAELWLGRNGFKAIPQLAGFVEHIPCGVLIRGSVQGRTRLEDHLLWCPVKDKDDD